jgi:hypothetical protein
MVAIQEKSMVPTVVVGVGGTGVEVMSRLRRLIQESYGDLNSFPIVSFLSIDTDRDYKVTNSEAAGHNLEDHEKHWARVTGNEVQDILSDMAKYPWIESWFPPELEKNVSALEAGAGQIRACGRFAFFFNYNEIRDKFRSAIERVKGHEQNMLSKYGVTVIPNSVNIFVVGSLSGGTGSGMLIDTGYCIRQWLQGQGSTSTTAIVPMPNAFTNISVGERVLENGYAALIELSYYSDTRTVYRYNFSSGSKNQISDSKPPFDFTYLVGLKNGEAEFSLDQIREMIALNIFLDLTSDFAPHKRSIRDNISKNWLQQDQAGRGYPRSFMSFGLSSIEFPLYQVRAILSNRMSSELIGWILNEQSILPPNMHDVLTADTFKKFRLSPSEIISDIASTGEAAYASEVSKWVNTLREFIASEQLTTCTLSGTRVIGQESGPVLQYTAKVRDKADDYRSNNLRDLGPDKRSHGAYLQRMYENRQKTIVELRNRLIDEMYSIVADRNRGPKYAKAFISGSSQILLNLSDQYRREIEKIWEPNYKNRTIQFEAALDEIDRIKTQYGVSKQSIISDLNNDVLTGLESSLLALIQKKSRVLALEVVADLQELISNLDAKLSRFELKLNALKSHFTSHANNNMLQADALKINGQKLFDRSKINSYFTDAITCMFNNDTDNTFDASLSRIGSKYIPQLLNLISPYWKAARGHDVEMKLWDIAEIPDIHDDDISEHIHDICKQHILTLPAHSLLSIDKSATQFFLNTVNNDDEKAQAQLKVVFNRSKPLIELDRNILQAADGFTPSLNSKVAIVGGSATADPAAQKLIPLILKRTGFNDVITPLGINENHRIVFVQEVGAFSLRSVQGVYQLRKSYKEWQSQTIKAKRERITGLNVDMPIPVHTDKQHPFWDLWPESDDVFRLVAKARALGVLRAEHNVESNQEVVRYSQISNLGREENIDIACSWEEAVLVLDLKDCDSDRMSVESQIDELMRNCDKERIAHQLNQYLNNRIRDFATGSDSIEYKRELKIIGDLADEYKLPFAQQARDGKMSLQSQRQSKDIDATEADLSISPQGDEVNALTTSSAANALQIYLEELRQFNLPREALVASAHSKGLALGLNESDVDTVLNCVDPEDLSSNEQSFIKYITALTALGLPDAALDAAVKAKAAELNISSTRISTLLARFK